MSNRDAQKKKNSKRGTLGTVSSILQVGGGWCGAGTTKTSFTRAKDTVSPHADVLHLEHHDRYDNLFTIVKQTNEPGHDISYEIAYALLKAQISLRFRVV